MTSIFEDVVVFELCDAGNPSGAGQFRVALRNHAPALILKLLLLASTPSEQPSLVLANPYYGERKPLD